ncbi:ketoacyl-ACP synthase III family protein [Kitasatospora sp. NPDC088351]|uniref:ketoacyl-ACP synthase III family protein n=1 Tax=unclassified Kitasatospora TaxID=2633591 RepID=UPI003425E154
MKWNELTITGLGVFMPPATPLSEAVETGRYDPRDNRLNQLVATRISAAESAPDMAVSAGRLALGRSGHEPGEISLVLHASLYHQGQDFWTPASYIQHHTVSGGGPAVHIQQGSNGGLAAWELAACFMAADSSRSAALVTTADRYCDPGFDRWNSDIGVVYADGATATVLSRRAGFAQICSMVSTSDPELEEMCRDTTGFTDRPHQDDRPLDLRTRKQRYVQKAGYGWIAERLVSGTERNIRQALDEADTDLRSIRRVVLPNLGRGTLEWEFLEPMEIGPERTLWDWGRHVSHLGAGDQAAGLAHLAETGQLRPGDHVLLVGVGIGFSWTSVVVRIDSPPVWPEQSAAAP